ncbi:MAG: response regulator [Deltaproteobacteria bacterium]|nr:response regulator [Deltaproteobacteria bacterium]
MDRPIPMGAESLRILLVDDEPNIREALCEYLEAINKHEVVCAADGEEALDRFQAGQFDCAFLDLKMPGMSGVELLSRLKASDKTLPVVIMTGFPSLDAAIDTMRQGASDFLIKPFNLKEVKITLERVVREQRLLKENLRLTERLKHQESIERLNSELQKRIREQHIIHQISEAIDQLHTSEDIYQGLADLACRFLDANKSAVLLLDRSTQQLLVIAVHGFDQSAVGRIAGEFGADVAGKVAAEGQPMLGRADPHSRLLGALPFQGNYLCLPILIRGENFGVMVVGDKRGGLALRGDDVFLARFLLQKAALSIENIALYESMVSNMHSTLGALVGAMEAKDPYTRQHSRRVTNLSVLTAQTMGLGIEQMESLRFAAYLHDIGKIGIKDHILLKESRLTNEEYEQIKLHPVIGESIIGSMDLSPQERAIIRHHHERWDGRGYPDGLGGEDIPRLARIVAVADAFDAMTSDRPYRQAKVREQAVAELLRCRDSQFDPLVVEAFMEMLQRYNPAGAREEILVSPAQAQTG